MGLGMVFDIQFREGDVGGGGRSIAQRRLGIEGASIMAGHDQAVELSLGRLLPVGSSAGVD